MLVQLRVFASEKCKNLFTIVIEKWKRRQTALQLPFDYTLPCKKTLYRCVSNEMCLMMVKAQGQKSFSYFEPNSTN